MSPALRRFLNALKRAIAICAVALVLVLLGIAATVYVAVSSPNLPLLRWGLGKMGALFEGQRTENLQISVHAIPKDGQLQGKASLRLRSTQGARNRFYFLFNPGLKVQSS